MRDGGGDVNVDLGGGALLYPDGARAAIGRQVDHYLTEPHRFMIAPRRVLEDCIEVNRLYEDMAQGQAGLARSSHFAPFGGFLIVFGLGLGYHLERLAERLRFKTMIVVEPHDDFLVHSAHAIDWAGLIARLAQDGRDIKIVSAADSFQSIVKIIRGPNFPLINGSYIFTHYQAPEFSDFGRQLVSKQQDFAMVSGWVEDQLTMLRNNRGNFARPGFHLQRARVASRRVWPAIVVGAGPSLDGDIERIRALRDRAVIISASSALKVLLEHGIRPDIHCELENGAGLAQVAESLAARHGGLADIVLYASATVDPGIAPHFKQAVYFFRSFLSSTLFYAAGAQTTALAEPTSGNTALHCALSLGFRDIYLFGLDFGARDPEIHHSRHSVYFQYESEDELATYTPYEFNTAVAANFGGEVRSGWLLNWGREAIAKSIREMPGVQVANCSDGAMISGARPLPAAAIVLPPVAMERDRDLAGALSELTFQVEPVPRREDLARLYRTHRDLLESFVRHAAAIDLRSESPQMEIVALWDKIQGELDAVRTTAAFRDVNGHMEAATAGAYYHASCLAPADAAAGLAAIGQSLAASFGRLQLLIDASFSEAAASRPDRPATASRI